MNKTLAGSKVSTSWLEFLVNVYEKMNMMKFPYLDVCIEEIDAGPLPAPGPSQLPRPLRVFNSIWQRLW